MIGALRSIGAAVQSRAIPILLVLVVSAAVAAAALGRSRARARADLADARGELAASRARAEQLAVDAQRAREALADELVACAEQREARAAERELERAASLELLEQLLGAELDADGHPVETVEATPATAAGAALQDLRRRWGSR